MKRTAACLLALAAFAVSADGFKEGQWELTTQMTMPGMPQMPQMPALPPGVQLPPGMKLPTPAAGGGYTVKHCMTKDHPVPKADRENPNMKCDTTKQNFSGGTLEWETHCVTKDGDEMNGKGKATYTGETMSSEAHMTGTSHGHPIDMTMKTTGKYLGPCPAQ